MGDFTLMATNNFKAFALDPNANVMSQADWEALPALLSGFTAGKASSAQVNKAIRQASFIAAALAQYTSDKTGDDVLDDGDQAAFIAKMAAAFGKDFQPLDATLTALAALTGAVDKLPYFNGADTAALTALTTVGRDIIGKSSIADVLSYLGLGDVLHKTNLGVSSVAGGSSSWEFSVPVLINGTITQLIFQGGTISSSGSGARTLAVTFNTTFPNAVLDMHANDIGGAAYPFGTGWSSTSSGTIYVPAYSVGTSSTPAATSSLTCRWFAIGY